MKLQKTLLLCAILALPLHAAIADNAAAPALTATEIMNKTNTVDRGDNTMSDVVMTVFDANGNKKESDLRMYAKKFGDKKEESRSIMFYTYPLTNKGVGFFSIDYDDVNKADKRWMYVPATRKTKSISSHDKRMSFMSSDFSHADMALQNMENNHYTLQKEEALNGKKVWVIEAVPATTEAPDDGYAKSVFYVQQDNFMTIKAIHNVKAGDQIKEMNVTKAEKIGEIWIPTEIIMETKKSDKLISKTVMEIKNTKFNNPFGDDAFFSERQLERGIPD